jgi:FMNH2-dependent dimethyl sulfone monooxygenase
MRFGYWMPIFGGWLRNVADEHMPVEWPYVRDLVTASERHGFDLSLIAELNLNDIKGHRAPAFDAWTLAPAVAAVTERLELMLAVRPNYHSPTAVAKALSTLDLIAPARLSLNVVSSWWQDEATQYGAPFDVHDARYARTEEWLTVLRRLLTEPDVEHHGALYDLVGTIMEPKPSVVPTVYMGGESPRAKEVITALGDAYVMHGDPPEVIAGKVADLNRRRTDAGKPPMTFGVSGFVICRDTEAEAQEELRRILDVRSSPEAYASYADFIAGSQLESQVSREEYSVSNRGLRAGLVGTPEHIIARLQAYSDAGVDLLLLQFSPQDAEMARFGREVIMPWRDQHD